MDQLQVGSFPERSLDMRGMFNLPLLRGGDETCYMWLRGKRGVLKI